MRNCTSSIAEVIAGRRYDEVGTQCSDAGRAGLVKVDGALKTYGKYFDHPGW